MSFRKLHAGKMFDGYKFLDAGSVIIVSNEGLIENIVDVSDAGDDVEVLEGVLTPGFINCHCHLELSHLRGVIPEGQGLVNFVLAVMGKRHASLEDILDHIASAENEMYVNGIVAVGDICNTAHTIPVKSKRLLHYHNFVEASGVDGKQAEKKFAQVLAIYEAFASLSPTPFLSNSIVPHSPYSVSPELWAMMINFPGNRLLSMHNQEDPNEDEWFLSHTGQFKNLYAGLGISDSLIPLTGMSSLRSVKDRFSRNQEILLVHNVTTSSEDLLSVKDNKIAWCLCPNANKYITNLMPPVQMLMNNEAKIVLGTDSLASNHQLSIYSEIQTMLNVFPELQLETALRWATSNGADVLGISGEFGSFAKGKKPGLVIINENVAKRVL